MLLVYPIFPNYKCNFRKRTHNFTHIKKMSCFGELRNRLTERAMICSLLCTTNAQISAFPIPVNNQYHSFKGIFRAHDAHVSKCNCWVSLQFPSKIKFLEGLPCNQSLEETHVGGMSIAVQFRFVYRTQVVLDWPHFLNVSCLRICMFNISL